MSLTQSHCQLSKIGRIDKFFGLAVLRNVEFLAPEPGRFTIKWPAKSLPISRPADASE